MLNSHSISAKDPYNSLDSIIYKLGTLKEKTKGGRNPTTRAKIGGQRILSQVQLGKAKPSWTRLY